MSAKRLAALLEQWRALNAPLDVPSATPGELRAWLRVRENVVQLARKAHASRQALSPLVAAREEHRAALGRELVAVGEPFACDVRLRDLLEHAETVLDREQKAAHDRDKLRVQSDDARADLDREQLALRTVDDELEAWREEWARLMGRLGREPETAPSRPSSSWRRPTRSSRRSTSSATTSDGSAASTAMPANSPFRSTRCVVGWRPILKGRRPSPGSASWPDGSETPRTGTSNMRLGSRSAMNRTRSSAMPRPRATGPGSSSRRSAAKRPAHRPTTCPRSSVAPTSGCASKPTSATARSSSPT